jgi:hypothetical protein
MLLLLLLLLYTVSWCRDKYVSKAAICSPPITVTLTVGMNVELAVEYDSYWVEYCVLSTVG